MREADAIDRARRGARATRTDRYVVWSIEETDAPGQHYHVATDLDLESFYSGCNVVHAIEPDGSISGNGA